MVPRSRPVRQDSVVRYQLARHRRRTLTLKDGTVVARGDHLLELHFDNRVLLGLASSPAFDPFATERSALADLRLLGAAIKAGEIGDIKALHAVTPFPAVLRRQGFQVTEIAHTLPNFFVRFYMTGLLALYHPQGWAGLSPDRARRWPGEAWLGLSSFLSRFAPQA
jgi:hypothetical protein